VQTKRGTIDLVEPKYYCSRRRKSFSAVEETGDDARLRLEPRLREESQSRWRSALSKLEISSRRIQRLIKQIGHERIADREGYDIGLVTTASTSATDESFQGSTCSGLHPRGLRSTHFG